MSRAVANLLLPLPGGTGKQTERDKALLLESGPDIMHTMRTAIPVIGFAAFSGTGKTALLEQLLPILSHSGVKAGVIKHAHHPFDIDIPGKDSYRLRKAGAIQTLVASSQRWALMTETPVERAPRLAELITHLDRKQLDLILVEGFKQTSFPKIELHRPELGHPLLFPADENIIAIASDSPLEIDTDLPRLNLNRPEEIANFILVHYLELDE